MILIRKKLIRIPESLKKLRIKIYDCKAHVEDNTMKVHIDTSIQRPYRL